MSKVDGPLWSDEATGSFASLITFSNQWGWAIVRGPLLRIKPPSSLQLSIRARLKTLILTWYQMSLYDKQLYKDKAPAGWTGFDLFIHENF